MKNKITCQNYIFEFHKEIDKRISRYLKTLEVHPYDVNLKEVIQIYLFYRLGLNRNHYIKQRQNGKNINDSIKHIDNYLEELSKQECHSEYEQKLDNIKTHPWAEILDGYKNALLIYVLDKRQFHSLIPFLRKINMRTLLLSDFEISDNIELSESITALTIEFSEQKIVSNTYLELNFPLIFHYYNTFETLFKILNPKAVICLDGCHFQERLLTLLAKKYLIRSYGIQSIFPYCINSILSKMSFDYYFTWGEIYSKILRKDNSLPKFISCGHIEENIKGINRVCFFICSTTFNGSFNHSTILLNIIKILARKHPNILFYIGGNKPKTHKVLSSLRLLQNVKIFSNNTLKDVFYACDIIVSNYQSMPVEGSFFNSIPIFLNPIKGYKLIFNLGCYNNPYINLTASEIPVFFNTLFINNERKYSDIKVPQGRIQQDEGVSDKIIRYIQSTI